MVISNKIQSLSNEELKFIEKLARSQMALEADKRKTYSGFLTKGMVDNSSPVDTCRKIIDAVQSQQQLNVTMSTKW